MNKETNLLKYKNVKGFVEFHKMSNDERKMTMNFVNKELIEKTENK